MFIYGAIFIFIAMVNGYPQKGLNYESYINGEEIEIDKAPYQVSIHGSKYEMCGGSILSTEWVLTSARCVINGGFGRSIRAGSSMSDQGGTLHQSVKIIVHEKFKNDAFGMVVNDIALIKVQPAFKLDQSRQAVQLVNQDENLKPNANCVVTGWGSTTDIYHVSNKLRMVQVPLMGKTTCILQYMPFGGLPDKQICTYDRNGKGPCNGDFGSPMIIEGRQAGIVLGGKGCGASRYPAVYTDIAGYRDWIESHSQI